MARGGGREKTTATANRRRVSELGKGSRRWGGGVRATVGACRFSEGGAALQFELEANNFEDENGNIKRGAYTDSGWVDEDAVDPMEALKKMWPFGGK